MRSRQAKSSSSTVYARMLTTNLASGQQGHQARLTLGDLLGEVNLLHNVVAALLDRALDCRVRLAPTRVSQCLIALGNHSRLLAQVKLLLEQLDQAQLDRHVGVRALLAVSAFPSSLLRHRARSAGPALNTSPHNNADTHLDTLNGRRLDLDLELLAGLGRVGRELDRVDLAGVSVALGEFGWQNTRPEPAAPMRVGTTYIASVGRPGISIPFHQRVAASAWGSPQST